MTRFIEWDGEPFAMLIESRGNGSYLVPPIVLGEDGRLIEGAELCQAVVQSGVSIEHPVIHGATAGDLAEVDRRMAHISRELGVPIGPPPRT